jgi:hypothetical protein
MAVSAFAQAIESDDMYFNKKDRVKLKAQKPVEETYIPYAKNKNQAADEVYASSAAYSARNVNPEFAARSNAQAAQTDNQDYFVADYQYKTAPANNLNQFNNNLNNWYNAPMYSSAYMGAAMYGWNSPYYGMNNMYSSPWYDPYYSNNGFSSSFSYYYGNPYNYGWGGNYNYWNQPYCGGSPWGMGVGMGMGLAYNYGWGGYNNYYGYGGYNGYSPNVIIVNSDGGTGRGVTYGKRPTSSGIVSHHANATRTRNDNAVVSNNGNGRTYTGGRTSSTSGRTSSTSGQQSAYYDRSWRNAQQVQTSNPSHTNQWNNQQNNSFDFNRTNTGNRPSSFDGGNSGGTRTHSPASTGGSSSGGRTSRGRD